MSTLEKIQEKLELAKIEVQEVVDIKGQLTGLQKSLADAQKAVADAQAALDTKQSEANTETAEAVTALRLIIDETNALIAALS